MALPKLNDSPKYDVVIPSTGKKVSFRPYLVKEEKILLLAMESKDQMQILKAVADTVGSCVYDEINVNTLTTFDIEYLFLKIRSKAVGERSRLEIKCSSCSHMNEYTLDLDTIKIGDVPKLGKIQLTDKIAIKMKWPGYMDIANDQNVTSGESMTSQVFDILLHCIDSIMTDDEVFSVKDSPREEVMAFIESMTSEQYGKITSWMDTLPSLSHDIEFDCEKCEEHNKVTLNGIYDFF